MNCPNCGAPVNFRWSGAVQTTCEYCKSILVRRDLNLEKVGVVGDVPELGSPVQLGTEGAYRGRAFSVVGRIIYEYERGGWNEWHVVFNDGASGWLSDAQLEYAVSFMADPGQAPVAGGQSPGQKLNWNGTEYTVTTITTARYRGVEGELPFEYWDKSDALFADLRTADGKFGTIDYSGESPLVFLGEFVDYDSLKLRNVREFEGW